MKWHSVTEGLAWWQYIPPPYHVARLSINWQEVSVGAA
jgi:hypothetical protein